MKLGIEKPSRQIGLVVVLLALLATLATLQYRWLGQVSVGERDRMRASLTTGAERFSHDFNREITRAYFDFQLGGDDPRMDLSPRLAERYDRWQKTSEHPELVKQVLVVGFDAQRKPVLLEFDPATHQLTSKEWPQDLVQLKQRIADVVAGDPGSEELLPLMLDPIQSDIPMLLAPAIYLSLPNKENKQGLPLVDSDRLPTYVAIRLDQQYITGKLLPALAERYFKGSTGLDYSLNVVKANAPDQVVFQTTDLGVKPQSPAGDATVSLFDLRMEEGGNLRFTSARLPTKVESNGSVTITRTKREIGSNPPPEPDTVVPASGKNVVLHIFNKQMTTDFRVRSIASNDAGHWQLIARHRSGSLDTFIANTRRRNLITSFGVLVLLAASVGFVLLAARRSHRLAQQQLEFVSSVSHEFRTPLAVICSAGENLEDGIINEPAQVAKYGALIRGEGRRLTEMVEQVLEFAGVQSGRKSYHLTEVSVDDLISDALTACRSQLQADGIEVETDIEANLPMVLADPIALRQSLQNLIGNAIKYGGAKHWLGLTAALKPASKGSEVVISVADHGIGIPESEQTRIFEPFYRGAEVVAAQIHGNGLGLSLVQRVVAAHQGKLTVTSRPGEGSVFSLHLPVGPASQTDSAKDFSAVPADGSLSS